MKDMILNECRSNLNRFKTMNDIEIYKWICDNFYCTDFEMMRKCSFIIFKESHI